MNNSLLALADAIQAETVRPQNETILVYGHSATGKTRILASLAKIPWIENLYWFDLENGSSALLTLIRNGYLTRAEAEKIKLFRIPDTPDMPAAFETTTKVLTLPNVSNKICSLHGRIGCADCAKDKQAEYIGEFQLAKTTPRDFVIFDTITQYGDSIMNWACKGKPLGFKPGWDEYGIQGRELNVGLSVIQAAKYCNFACGAQALLADYEEMGQKKERIFPLCGTKAFSAKVGKYFAHKIYLSQENKQHKAGSATTYKLDVLTGSRSDWRIEDLKSEDKRLDILYEEIATMKLLENKKK